ncbi:kinase-like domain-containing protein [Halenospora varia]|nr:kinase-like domain-containing protein [Halenospora varia]
MERPPTPNTARSPPSATPHPLILPTAFHRRQRLSLSDVTLRPSPSRSLQMYQVKETYKAKVERDFITDRKLINQYEIINEIGRGAHSKVKLARSLEREGYVAIKIIPRFSKKRRLGSVTVSPEEKTAREIAVLKKTRHPNVVSLLEVIDDPELKKIYLVLEYVELGEILWREKVKPYICIYERRRMEREINSGKDARDEEKLLKMFYWRHLWKETQRVKDSKLQRAHGNVDYLDLEHDADKEEAEMAPPSRAMMRDSSQNLPRSERSITQSDPGSRAHLSATAQRPSQTRSRDNTPPPTEFDIPPLGSDNEEETASLSLSILSNHGSSGAFDGTTCGCYLQDSQFRGWSPSPSLTHGTAWRMSSDDDITQHDPFEDEFSYVPTLTIDQARSAFRDTVLGLQYLHLEGIIHRDIKPANLLLTEDHRVKIADFGVSYFGRHIREGEVEGNVSEDNATLFDDLDLAKTVGTPAFFAPELCCTDLDVQQPRVTEQIDVWSLGVTLYCLIYARIPFMAGDEFQLFRAIAHEEPYVPRRRLKAVYPSCSTWRARLNKRIGRSTGPYRAEEELALEDIDEELYDLLRRMLIKDPVERIKLGEITHHPWVTRNIDNTIG